MRDEKRRLSPCSRYHSQQHWVSGLLVQKKKSPGTHEGSNRPDSFSNVNPNDLRGRLRSRQHVGQHVVSYVNPMARIELCHIQEKGALSKESVGSERTQHGLLTDTNKNSFHKAHHKAWTAARKPSFNSLGAPDWRAAGARASPVQTV